MNEDSRALQGHNRVAGGMPPENTEADCRPCRGRITTRGVGRKTARARTAFDPVRVGSYRWHAFPGALPPATLLIPSGDHRSHVARTALAAGCSAATRSDLVAAPLRYPFPATASETPALRLSCTQYVIRARLELQ